VEGSDEDLIEAVPRHLAGATEERDENLGQVSQCTVRDSNRTPPEYKCRSFFMLCLMG
jgi:hypothetical protein